jgi:predicted transglutaminase-like cysteine proteinase
VQNRRRLAIVATAVALTVIYESVARARWATDEDTSAEVEFQNDETVLHADGTWESVVETQLKVLKEDARSRLAVGTFAYNSNIQTLEVLEAHTTVGGDVMRVAAQTIEDKPMASSVLGFDELHQVLVPFPAVAVGVSLYAKVRTLTREAAFPGFWSAEYRYGMPTRELGGRVHVRSEIPLYLERHDPDHALDIDETTTGDVHEVTITLARPVYRVPVDEDDALLDFDAFPWVAISTRRDWTSVAHAMSEKYEAVLTAMLPPRFEAIRARAAEESTLVDRINAVTSGVAAQVHYLGDWRTIAGKYVPRDLATVAETQYGDCKDFASTTTAILRALGIPADVAWIRRGAPYRRTPVHVALLSDFNHAIVHVREDGDGAPHDRWIDPTNFTSFAQGTYPDIAGRQAYVLNAAAAALLATPALRPEDAEVRVSRVVHFAPADELRIDGTLELHGVSAIGYTGARLTRSTRSVDWTLARYLGARDDLRTWTVEPYDLTSRVVHDLAFRVHLVQRDSPMRTSAGDAFYLGTGGPSVSGLLTPTDQRVSGLANGPPQRYQWTTELRDVKRIGRHSLDCAVKSPWIDFTRTVRDIPRGVRIEDEGIVHQEIIPNVELRSERFAAVQQRIRECLSGASVVYERLPSSERAGAHSRPGPVAQQADQRVVGLDRDQTVSDSGDVVNAINAGR